MTIPNITKTVMKGFGTGVGGFSNTATIMYAMAANFEKPGSEAQHDELMLRIKLLREIVGQEIDRIKGADKPVLPAEWKKLQKILPTDTQDEINAKFQANALVIRKKPYFFRYLYPALNQKFKQFEASYNQVSRDMFGIKFKKLLKKEDKTPEEKDLVRKYQTFSPLITSPCTMNKLCRAIEDVDFDIKFFRDDSPDAPTPKKPVVSKLPTFEEKYASTYTQERFSAVQKLYQQFSNRKQLLHLDAMEDILSCNGQFDDYDTFHAPAYDFYLQEIRDALDAAAIPGDEFLFYCHKLSQHYSKFNWGFAWSVLGDRIVKLIPAGKSCCPIRDDAGTYEYLGLHYSMKDLSSSTTSQEEVQDIVDSLFGETDQEIPDENLLQEVIRIRRRQGLTDNELEEQQKQTITSQGGSQV